MTDWEQRARQGLADGLARVGRALAVGSPPPAADVVGQRNLYFHYQRLLADGQALPSFEEAGFGVYSAGNEDGILLLLLACVGTVTRRCIEIGAGNPKGANTTNLLVHWAFEGLLVEGADLQGRSARFFLRQPHVDPRAVHIEHAWVTTANIDQLLGKAGFSGEVDVLSLDIDGVDYWIWEAISVTQPRVLVVEVQDIWGPDEAVTVPYDPSFQEGGISGFTYCGASLHAWVKLNRRKGYRLVAATPDGLNAFFVRNGLAEEALPEVSPSSCLDQPWLQEDRRLRLVEARRRAWVEV